MVKNIIDDDRRLKSPLIWIDCEMTGLDAEKDTILEIAVIVTDGELSRIKEGPDLVIHHPDSVLSSMSEWCIEHHGKSGLTDRVRSSTISMTDAEDKILEFVKKWAPKPGETPLAGNTVHCDRVFLKKYMPRLDEYMHYRIVDVSSFKEICKRWFPREFSKTPKKQLLHRALDDIRESIQELRYYKDCIFIDNKKSNKVQG